MKERLQEQTVQDRKKGTERVQTKLGKTHVDYWYKRLQKRTYIGRDGSVVEIPSWQVRMKCAGRAIYFNLETTNRAEASVKARDIYLFLKANGLEATLKKFKSEDEETADSNLTVEEFGDLYRKEIELVEYPPLRHTIERYISCLLLICSFVGVKRIARLTVEKICLFKVKYFKRAIQKGRDETKVKTTINSHLRGAACLFSKQMLDVYRRRGVNLVNPFEGQRFRRIELKPCTPLPRELLDSIWQDSAKLRDGDPDAPARPTPNKGGRPKKGTRKQPPKKEVRWKEPDWRKPFPAAYQILLLELGLGLRRHESDKAEWDWFFVLKGRRYVEVRKTEFFTPKGKRRRILPVEDVLWEALLQLKPEGSRFVVPGNEPIMYTRQTAPKNLAYRCEGDHRILVAWLRKKGIKDSRPCHLLRKEFGSYVATSFGLFVAQRLLGHSSPTVTEAFYAGLTNLPELQHAQPPVRILHPAPELVAGGGGSRQMDVD